MCVYKTSGSSSFYLIECLGGECQIQIITDYFHQTWMLVETDAEPCVCVCVTVADHRITVGHGGQADTECE